MRRALLELVAPSVCPLCGAPRRPGETLLCGAPACQPARLQWLGPVATAFAYRGAGLELVRRFKFDGRRDALEVAASALAERLARVEADLLVPLPRHPWRIRETGDDPVHRLGRALAARLGLPFEPRALWRTRPTPPQTGLGVEARRANVAGSFAADPRRVSGRRPLVVDDVATTGATLEAAAEALRTAGSRPPRLAAVAATPAFDGAEWGNRPPSTP